MEDTKGPEEFQALHRKVVESIPDMYTDILTFSYAMNKNKRVNTGSEMNSRSRRERC